MPMKHKYIKKYRNSHGNWTYVYPGDVLDGKRIDIKAPKMYESRPEDQEAWNRVSSNDASYRLPNGYTPGQHELDNKRRGPKISPHSTNNHNPNKSYTRSVRNTNSWLSSDTKVVNDFTLSTGHKHRSVLEFHETGKIERAYNRGKRKADKLRRSAKKTTAKAISRGKRAVRDLLPHTEVTHDVRLH